MGGIAGGLLIEVIKIFCSTTERSIAEPVRSNQDCMGEKGIELMTQTNQNVKGLCHVIILINIHMTNCELV